MYDIIHGNIYSLQTQDKYQGRQEDPQGGGIKVFQMITVLGSLKILITTSGNVKVLGTLKIIITSSEN